MDRVFFGGTETDFFPDALFYVDFFLFVGLEVEEIVYLFFFARYKTA